MPKKYSHSNLPEPDEFRRRAMKMFDDNDCVESCENEIFVANEYTKNGKKMQKEDENCDEFEESKSKSKIRTVKDYALYLVSVNTYTERKLREKLALKKREGQRLYSESEIDEAVEYLKGFGYINDLRLAQNSLDKLAARCWGKIKIRFYLIKNGISEEIVDSLDFSEIDFDFYCRKLLAKYKDKPREKQYRALINAGYSNDEVFAVLGEERI